MDGLNSRSEDFEKNIKSIEEQLQTVQQAGENALNGEDPVGNTIEAGKAAKDAYGTVSGYVDDPESFISGVLTVPVLYWQCSKKMQSMAFLHTWLIRWQNPVS